MNKNKTKRLIILAAAIVLAAIAGIFIFCTSPKRFKENLQEINKIYIFNGNTGKDFTVSDSEQIEYIADNIKNSNLKRDGISLGYVGYGFKLKFLDSQGNVLTEIIVNSEDTIRKDPFFYTNSNEELCFDYLLKLEQQLS